MKPELSKKQLHFLLSSDARINIADGAIRSGKTFVFNLRWLDYIVNGPKGTLLMAGKTIRTLERNVLKTENGLFDLVGEGNYKYNGSTGELEIAGRKIICIGASDERSENKIRGMTLAGALCDEVTLFPKSFIEQLIGRCSVAGSMLFWNCNPDSPYHFIKQEYLENPNMKPLIKHWRFLMYDNPYLVKTNPEYIKQAETTYTGVFYKRNVLGQWALAEGIVYDNFTDECIVEELPEEFDEIYVGVDHGVTHPATFIMIGVKDREVYVIKEFCQSNRTNSELADEFINFIDGYSVDGITVDSAAASLILEFNKRGIYTTDCNKEVVDGITLVTQLIGENRLFVHKSCKNLIKEFYTYSWDDKKSISQGKDVVIKLNDDCCDALRYACKTFLDFDTRAYAYDLSSLGF
ncbi:PBSX family phage terminase large subunit [Clostridium celatum]|uniref:PBSX family phage terminase large subunit n=1 Tax=Clostridium celatum TaxID=36834 RepID=UPI001F429214|nr:PBSX family phage terminase large subunit [Clostridium celatum]MCE9654201.1 PBSX family phage terminase large subunit [Clostridium celatum]